jgi:hypothetical protein
MLVEKSLVDKEQCTVRPCTNDEGSDLIYEITAGSPSCDPEAGASTAVKRRTAYKTIY